MKIYEELLFSMRRVVTNSSALSNSTLMNSNTSFWTQSSELLY